MELDGLTLDISEGLENIDELSRDGPRVAVFVRFREARTRPLGRRDEIDRDPALVDLINHPGVLFLDLFLVTRDVGLGHLKDIGDLKLKIVPLLEKISDADPALMGRKLSRTELLL